MSGHTSSVAASAIGLIALPSTIRFERFPENLLCTTALEKYSEGLYTNGYRPGPRCIVYPSGAPAPVFSHLRTRTADGSPILPTDLDIDVFFPNGCISVCFDTAPNGFPLSDNYRLFMSSGVAFSPLNKCITRKFKQSWYGSLILAKYDRNGYCGMGNIQGSDTEFLDLFVGMWIEDVLRGPDITIFSGLVKTFAVHEHITNIDELSQNAEMYTRTRRTGGATFDSRSNRTSVKCLLYPVGGTQSEICKINHLGSSSSAATPHNLNVSMFFPAGYCSFKLVHAPGTSFPLTHDLRIYVSHKKERYCKNNTVAHVFDQRWSGNVIVAKYSKHRTGVDIAVNIHPYETSVLDVILGMWIEDFFATAREPEIEI